MRQKLYTPVQIFVLLNVVIYFYLSATGVSLVHPYYLVAIAVMLLVTVLWSLVRVDIIKADTFTTKRNIINGFVFVMMFASLFFAMAIPTFNINISSPNDFHKFKWNSDGDFILKNDIDMSNIEYDQEDDKGHEKGGECFTLTKVIF